METVDEEVTTLPHLDFMDRAHKAEKPFFVWWKHAHGCIRLDPPERTSPKGRPDTACTPTAWPSTMAMVGQLLAKLDELGIAENTIVMYSTDNGAEVYSAGQMAERPCSRNEKATQWEGGFRVPTAIRWPGRHQTRHSRE